MEYSESTTYDMVSDALHEQALYDDPQRITPQDADYTIRQWLEEGSITADELPPDYSPELFAVLWNELLPQFTN